MSADSRHTDERPPYSLMTVADLLDAFASSEPVPGGGSAAALAGTMGVSLLVMVAGMTRTRTGAPEEAADLAEASSRLRILRDRLTALVDEDSDAYSAVIDARRLPKTTPAETAARSEAIESAMGLATQAPLETMECCQQALRGAAIVARCGSPRASSDTATAVHLLLAALNSAALNVDANVGSLTDAALAGRIADERAQLKADGETDAREALDALEGAAG